MEPLTRTAAKIVRPSGDHPGRPIWNALRRVMAARLLPSGSPTQISSAPVWPEILAILFPSGDQLGAYSRPSERIRRRALDRGLDAVRSIRQMASSAGVSVNARRCPPGATAGNAGFLPLASTLRGLPPDAATRQSLCWSTRLAA